MAQVAAPFLSPERCCQLMVKRGIRMPQDTEWAKLGWAMLLKAFAHICNTQRRPVAPFEPDTMKTLPLTDGDSFFAAVFWALGCVQSDPLPAQKRFCKAWPRMAIHAPQVGHEHTQNIHTIRSGSSSKKHPNTTLGTGVKSGSTSGLLWSTCHLFISSSVISSSPSGEGWQQPVKKKDAPYSQAEK